MSDKNTMNSLDYLRNSLIFQFDISWQMLQYHFTNLKDEECLWRPSVKGLHVTNSSGIWKADWPDSENYDIGPSSIAWLTWHIIYWWSMVYDYSFGDGTLTREHVYWPGNMAAVIEKINQFRDQWVNILSTIPDKELLSYHIVKWPFNEKSFYELAAWLNLELMKNASEIGCGRFLYATQK